MQNMKKIQALVGGMFVAAAVVALCAAPVYAQTENRAFSIHLDQPTIARGYTVQAFEGAIKFALIPGILSEATAVDVLELHEPLETPWELDQVSEVYQFEFYNKNAYDNHTPFVVQLHYDAPAGDDGLKQVYYYDKNYSAWRPLPTKDYPGEKMARAFIHLPFARLAVFSNPQVMSSGAASWYAYQGGDFAASPDFPKGSRVRVYNAASEAFVDVVINDWGPDRAVHPERVIDLDKVAFAKIAPLGAGVVDVIVEPLYVPTHNGQVLGVRLENNTADKPTGDFRAAAVLDAESEELLFSRAATTTLPLASLTKLVTAAVFLETNPDLDEVVAYIKQDEEKNWAYVEPYLSARLRVEDGDTMTVRDLLLSTLVSSTNNTAESLARLSGLPRAEFIARMNALAREWGATQTQFFEPSGLAPENVSSAHDYAIITKHALAVPEIAQATTMREYRFETKRDKKEKVLRNTNYLLNNGDFVITGGKTGYLHEAGYCLMTAITVGGRQVIAVMFGSPSREESFNDMASLLRWSQRQLIAVE